MSYIILINIQLYVKWKNFKIYYKVCEVYGFILEKGLYVWEENVIDFFDLSSY